MLNLTYHIGIQSQIVSDYTKEEDKVKLMRTAGVHRGEFSSVCVVMGGEVGGKKPSCVSGEGGTL